jgi:Uncharacterised protein conserved in bacteria (DUF2336)
MIPGLSLSGLENVAAGEDSPRRDAILRALTKQYIELEPRLSDRHIDLYDNVFRLLVNGIEVQARLALAEKLAPMKRAPREVVRDLANDEYSIVAAPVLQQSPVLDDADLISVARLRGEAHRVALAQRPDLATLVTDVLIDKREQAVLAALVINDTALLSTGGATTVTDIAASNMVVAQALAVRLKLPATALNQILEAARATVVNTLAHSQPDARAGDITSAVGTAVTRVGSLPSKAAEDVSQDHLVTLYSMNSLDEVIKGLVRLTGMERNVIRGALNMRSPDALLIVLKVAGFEDYNVEAMMSIKLGIPVGWPALKEPMAQFERINTDNAERMLGIILSREQSRA